MNIRQWAIAAVLAAGSLFVGAGSALAVDNAMATAFVNGRSCPSTGCGVLYVLPTGATVEVISTSGNWCQSNRVGFPTVWVSCSYLAPIGGGGGGGGGGAPPAPPPPNVNFCFTGPQGNQVCLGSGGVGVNVNVPGPQQVCFYEEPNYAGAQLCKTAGYSDAIWDLPWRNNIRSVKITGTLSVVMCAEWNFAGYCRTYTSNTAHIHSPLRDHTRSVSVN